MKELSECLHIVDVIEELGGCQSVKNFLAIAMRDDDIYESVLNGEINGKIIRESHLL